MPTIEAGIFQWATLGLLAVITLLVLLVSQSLNQIKKDLAERSASNRADDSRASAYAQPASADQQPAVSQSAYSASPVTTTAPAPSAYSVQEPAPVATAVQPAVAQVAPQPGAEPQDQPFERDGRWWYRRGTELLVYDEQAAQWVPAPAETAGATGVAAVATVAPAAAAMAEPGGTFWKCSSCGAVNGSTANSCRMCFAARA